MFDLKKNFLWVPPSHSILLSSPSRRMDSSSAFPFIHYVNLLLKYSLALASDFTSLHILSWRIFFPSYFLSNHFFFIDFFPTAFFLYQDWSSCRISAFGKLCHYTDSVAMPPVRLSSLPDYSFHIDFLLPCTISFTVWNFFLSYIYTFFLPSFLPHFTK